MTMKVEPRIIDFTFARTPAEEAQDDQDYQALLKELRGGAEGIRKPLEYQGYITYYYDSDGRLRYHTRPVPEWRLRRARRILWECQQRPEWPYRQGSFFRHPALKGIPYVALKKIYREGEN